MNVKGFLLGSLLLSCIAGCAADSAESSEDGAAAVTTQETTIEASISKAHKRLDGFEEVREIANPDGLTIRLYLHASKTADEFNGLDMWLGIFDANGKGAVFNLDRLHSITKIEHVAPHSLRIVGFYDQIFASTTVAPTITHDHPYEGTVQYQLEAGEVYPQVHFECSNWVPMDPWGTRDVSEAMLANVTAVRTASRAGVDVSAIQVSGLEPAMNGPFVSLGRSKGVNASHVLLGINGGLPPADRHETFDLGLDVARVDSISFVAADRLRIEGSEDVRSDNGDIEARPFKYSVRFSVDADGVPKTVVGLERLPR